MGRGWSLVVASQVALACGEPTDAQFDEDESEAPVSIDAVELAFHRMHDDVWAVWRRGLDR